MRVVFICNEYPPARSGGIGIFTKKLAEGLVAFGHEVFVVGTYRDQTKNLHEIINGVQVVRLPGHTGRLGIILDRLSLYRALKSLGGKKNIDVIECPDFEGGYAFVPRMAKAFVSRLHGSHTYFSAERHVAPSGLIRKLEMRQLMCSDKIVSVSRYTAEKTRELFSLSVTPDVIYNSVDVGRFDAHVKQAYGRQKRAIYYGTLVEKKGVYPLSEAWRHFHEAHPDWHLTVVGKDTVEEGQSCRQRMQDILGEALASVNFIEHMQNQDLVSSLKDYDVAILPSFSEAFALAPMEAMAVGLPVIISGMSSGPELVRHADNGLLCDPREPSTLCDALRRVADDEVLRERLGRAGRETIQHQFGFDDFMTRNLDLYQELLLRSTSL